MSKRIHFLNNLIIKQCTRAVSSQPIRSGNLTSIKYANQIYSYSNLEKIYAHNLSLLRNKRFKKFAFKMDKPNLLLLSSSAVHGYGYLEYATKDIQEFLNKRRVKTILFIPYALPDHDAYLAKVRRPFENWGYQVTGIHESDPIEAIDTAEAVFVGGGNTFLLLKSLYEKNLINHLRKRILEEGLPYMGASAGTNVAARTIHNTNDMPIVHPESFDALRLIPFNINPHYIDADRNTKHKGETREERIQQYHQLPPKYETFHVLALREGCSLLVEGQGITLLGVNRARLFLKKQLPEEIIPGSNLSFLNLPDKEIERRSMMCQCQKSTAV